MVGVGAGADAKKNDSQADTVHAIHRADSASVNFSQPSLPSPCAGNMERRSAKLSIQKRLDQRGVLLVEKRLSAVHGPMNHFELDLKFMFLVGAVQFM